MLLLLLPGKRYLNRLSSLDHMQSHRQSSSKQAENAAAALDFLRVQGMNTRTNVLPFPPSARAATGTEQRPRPRANAIFVFDDRCVSKQNRRQRLLLSMISPAIKDAKLVLRLPRALESAISSPRRFLRRAAFVVLGTADVPNTCKVVLDARIMAAALVHQNE